MGTPAAGFAEPVFEAQRVFRTLLSALADPGRCRPLATDLRPPLPLTPELAAATLALADQDTPLWLDAALRSEPAVAAYLRFHTGAPIVDNPDAAAFALIVDATSMPSFDAFAQGTDEYPDRSTTVMLAVIALTQQPAIRLAGPGIRGDVGFAARGAPEDLSRRLAANHAAFPRGIDLLLLGPACVLAVPRSSAVLEAA